MRPKAIERFINKKGEEITLTSYPIKETQAIEVEIKGNRWPKYFLLGTKHYEDMLDLAVEGTTWHEFDAEFNRLGAIEGRRIRAEWRQRHPGAPPVR